MNKPYIFAHRGASGYCIENTMDSFQKAVEMKVGIETDVRLTKDKKLICFHDSAFKIDDNWYSIENLTLSELKDFNFQDNRVIPTMDDIFNTFNYCPDNLRYSCDIGKREDGLALINLIKKYSMFEQVEITDTRLITLKLLRKANKEIKLDYTLPYHISKINKNTVKFDKLLNNDINVINIKFDRANNENFRAIIDNGFECYIWGVNSKYYARKVLNFKFKEKFVSGIYSNFPDMVKKIRDKIYS
jgi:glycerophosphoryl diester phosphodiesterase